MAQQEFRYDKPAVKVAYTRGRVGEESFNQLLLGIEEEGIPFELVAQGDDKASGSLAHEASLASRLGVGIGVAPDGMTLHYNKLDEDLPLFRIPLNASVSAMRALGANAARLVKGQPFKDLK